MTLFVARARHATPNFSTDEEQLAEVAKLCTDLDRLPLALELAAARVGALSPADSAGNWPFTVTYQATSGPAHGRALGRDERVGRRSGLHSAGAPTR